MTRKSLFGAAFGENRFSEKNKLCIVTAIGGSWLNMSNRECGQMYQLVTGFNTVLTMNG